MDNSKKNIDDLLEKYWSGETSIREENDLKTYFSGKRVADHHKQFAPLFTFFSEEASLKEIDVSDQVMQKINTSDRPKIIPISNWRKIISIAASLLLLLSVSFGWYQYTSQLHHNRLVAISEDTFNSPEEALAQTKAALEFMSSHFNKGSEKAEQSITKTTNLNILN